MQLAEYVEKKFGAETAEKMKKIRIGGDNNHKGGAFETFYAAAKVCDIAANQHELDDFLISSQEEAFVDDLCVRQKSVSCKKNYQAKNSSGNAASWNADIESRFRIQLQIDTEFHQCPSSQQVLLVSCMNKARKNAEKIPRDLTNNCFSEYFPYHSKSTQILYSWPELRANLEKICATTNLSTLDTAFRYVVSAWTCDDAARSVGDIIGQAKAMSKPDVFGALIPEPPELPDWIHRLCVTFQGLTARVESGRFSVSYNGFDVSLGPSQAAEPEPEALASLSDVGQVFAFLMSIVQEEL